MNAFTKLGLAAVSATVLASAAAAETELTMYYPIAVGGALTEVVDGIVADFEAANPDIKVNAIYSGNYDDTRVRALSALSSGEPAQLHRSSAQGTRRKEVVRRMTEDPTGSM